MNYIRHMNAFFTLLKEDERLTSSHVSLYLALFQYWNYNRFQNPFPVYRDNIMNLSKIGSKNTYHKCIKELHEAGYIYYHPSPSKFLPVKVSIGRLDIPEEPISRFKQLELFNPNASTPTVPTPSPLGGRLGWGPGAPSPNIDTDHVPNLTATCTDFDTVPVPKMGHNIKQKHFNKTESKPPSQKIFDKNEKLSQGINRLAGVPNSRHQRNLASPLEGSQREGAKLVERAEVEEFFKQNNYPVIEAQKFFNHYKAIGWKIKGITPIEDWQAAAHKWMINAKKWEPEASYEDKSSPLGGGFRRGLDIQTLYARFLAGHNIFTLITQEHFTELKIELSDEVLKYARGERISQLTGSNQNSVLKLLQAYQENKENDPLLLKDRENLVSLAKRIAVIKHFKVQKL